MILAGILQSFGADSQDMSTWLLWLIALGAMALLLFGADRAVAAAVKLAKAMHIPTVVIGATVVSLGTTSPEACVSVMAAFRGEPGLALGNGVGSIICDTALIFGLCCCIARLPRDRYMLNRYGWVKLGAGTLLALIMVAGALMAGGITDETAGRLVMIPRMAGVGLLVLLVGYMYMSLRWSRSHPQMIPERASAEGKQVRTWAVAVTGLSALVVGLGMVVAGSDVLIGAVQELGGRYHVPEHVMAATLVAFGTSLPELATALAAIKRGHAELLVGNIIGADILNVLFVVGASATAAPLKVEPLFFTLHMPVMMVGLLMLQVFILGRGKTFKRWQGVPLLGLYVYYIVRLVALRQF